MSFSEETCELFLEHRVEGVQKNVLQILMTLQKIKQWTFKESNLWRFTAQHIVYEIGNIEQNLI